MLIRTVLGNKEIEKAVTLPHEHICTYSDWLLTMSKDYLDKETLLEAATAGLVQLREQFGLGLMVDCTGVNMGRDMDLLKNVSAQSGVDIVCSTGFYYTDEPILYATPADVIAQYLVADAKRTNAGVLKAAVETEKLSDYGKKLMLAYAITNSETGLPIVLHTNAKINNGVEAVEILMDNGVAPSKITVAHLSDSNSSKDILYYAELGCYIGLDRLYGHHDPDYIHQKVEQIMELIETGYSKQIMLSHDDLFFNGFSSAPQIVRPRFHYLFDTILPALKKSCSDHEAIDEIISVNTLRFLSE